MKKMDRPQPPNWPVGGSSVDIGPVIMASSLAWEGMWM